MFCNWMKLWKDLLDLSLSCVGRTTIFMFLFPVTIKLWFWAAGRTSFGRTRVNYHTFSHLLNLAIQSEKTSC